MKIKPFGTLILVERLGEEKKTASGLILSESVGDIFVKMDVIAVGDQVKNVKPETVVIGHDLIEYIETGSRIGFISETHVFGEVEES